MANTQAVSVSFMTEMLLGNHQLGSVTLVSRTSLTAPTTDTLKAALYLTSATINKSTTAYSATNEVANSGTYAAGGTTVTNATTPSNDGTVTFWTPSAAFTWTGVTATAFDTVLIYNSTQSNKAIANYNFGSQTVVTGNITLNMPTNNGTTGLIRFT